MFPILNPPPSSQFFYYLVAKWSLTLLWPHGLKPARQLCPWDFPGKNIGVGCHLLLQGIFPTQRSNPGLLHCRQILYLWVLHKYLLSKWIICWLKKCTMWELWVKSYLEQNYDYSLGCGLSELLHRSGGGDINIYVILVKRDRSNQSHIWKKVAASYEEQVSLLMILVLFWIWEDARNWTHKIFYLKACSARFPRSQNASYLISTLNSYRGMLEVSNCSG